MFSPLPFVNFPLVSAPMVGLSHQAWREVLADYTPALAQTLAWSEMLNSRRLPREDFARTPEVMRGEMEKNWVPQLLGNEESEIAPSVAKLETYGAVAIDINMGCPVKKALKHNYGVALMGDAAYAAEVVRMTKRNSRVPVGVKLRAGHENNVDSLKHFIEGLYGAGADWICLHPRTIEQQRRGSADWNQIRIMKENFGMPIIGNGDVQVWSDVFRMREQTGCDLVMAGRGLSARPWMLWQVGEELGFPPPAGRENERAPRSSEEEGAEHGRSLKLLLTYLVRALHYLPTEDLILRKFKFHVRTTHVWLPFGLNLYAKVSAARSVRETEEALAQFFSRPVQMSERTELRQ